MRIEQTLSPRTICIFVIDNCKPFLFVDIVVVVVVVAIGGSGVIANASAVHTYYFLPVTFLFHLSLETRDQIKRNVCSLLIRRNPCDWFNLWAFVKLPTPIHGKMCDNMFFIYLERIALRKEYQCHTTNSRE